MIWNDKETIISSQQPYSPVKGKHDWYTTVCALCWALSAPTFQGEFSTMRLVWLSNEMMMFYLHTGNSASLQSVTAALTLYIPL